MSELPNPANGYRATLDYPLDLANLNAILGGMWDALQPYRDVVAEANTAINDLNARTLQVIGDSITPELDAVRADLATAQQDIDNFTADAQAQFDALLAQDFSGLNDPGAARVNIGAAERAWQTVSTAHTAQAGDRIKADTSGGAFTILLPATLTDGDEFWFMDPGATWGTNTLTIDGNGVNIVDAPTFPCAEDGGYFLLIFDGTAWQVRFAGAAS
ncbi:hypothetical protein [Sulfitobacter sp.]|uniref:hypothetical protein n=1 Tax=Sulfitobacter sp. TaxID=1903071 RepID=UPI0025D3A2E9|nr:hypothetical protein [Sulfitobacter sp.]